MTDQENTQGSLRRVLAAMAEGESRSQADLARALGLSEALLQPMLVSLAQRGYLQRLGGACASQCDACSLKPGCIPTGGEIWSLSTKGRRAIGA